MVDDALTRASTFRVGLDACGAVIAPGLSDRPSHSCDGWVCGLGVVSTSLVFGLVRGTDEVMVGGSLTRASAFRVGLGVSGTTIVSGS